MSVSGKPQKGREAPYFQFPLCLLQLPPKLPRRSRDEDFAERVLAEYIVAWTLASKGPKLRARQQKSSGKDKEQQALKERLDTLEEKRERTGEAGRLPHDFDRGQERHRAIVAANEWFIGLKNLPKIELIVARYEHVREHKRKYIDALGGGRDRSVRMRKDLVARLLYWKIMSRREFCVLAGFYSAIGRSWYARVSLRYAGFLAAGYKSEKAYDKTDSLREDLETKDDPQHEPMPRHKVRYTRDKLLDDRWLFRYHDGRHCYYSNRRDEKALADAVEKRKQKGRTKRESRLDREAAAKKKARRKYRS